MLKEKKYQTTKTILKIQILLFKIDNKKTIL